MIGSGAFGVSEVEGVLEADGVEALDGRDVAEASIGDALDELLLLAPELGVLTVSSVEIAGVALTRHINTANFIPRLLFPLAAVTDTVFDINPLQFNGLVSPK